MADHAPPPGNKKGITRREALIAGAAVLAGTTAGFFSLFPPEAKLVRRLPKANLVLIGGGASPNQELSEIATSLGIAPEYLIDPVKVREVLSAGELQKLAIACDPYGVFREMKKFCPLDGKTVVCVTSASSDAEASARYNRLFFQFLGASDVVTITSRMDADNLEKAQKIRDKNTCLVYFSGGVQSRLVENFVDTEAFKALRFRYLTDSLFTVAGSSAGAAAEPGKDQMIKDWNQDNTGAALGSGFGLVQNIIVDTHLHRSENFPRLPRLLDALKQRSECIGIGLDEGTGIVIRGGNATVIGGQKVWKLTQDDIHRTAKELEALPGFTNGQRFDLGQHAYLTVPQSYYLQDSSLSAANGRR